MDLYQDQILEHYHEPHNSGKIKSPTHERSANNPTCGDKISVTAIVKDGVVKDVKFEGDGCAISQASASMITEEIIGKKVEDVLKITRDDITEMLGIEIGIGRIRCALLGIETIQKALEFGCVSEQ